MTRRARVMDKEQIVAAPPCVEATVKALAITQVLTPHPEGLTYKQMDQIARALHDCGGCVCELRRLAQEVLDAHDELLKMRGVIRVHRKVAALDALRAHLTQTAPGREAT